MAFIKCFDIARMTLDSVVEESGGKLEIDNEELKRFQNSCNAIDRLVADSGGTGFDVLMKDGKMRIAFECESLALNVDSDTTFFDAINGMISVGVSSVARNLLYVVFIYKDTLLRYRW